MRLIDADALEREGWKLHRSYQQGENTMVYETKSIQEILDKLPSAEPENLQPTCNQLATNCISRQAAIDAVNNLTYPSSLVDVKRILVDLPTVQPERKKGKWVKAERDGVIVYSDAYAQCSMCKEVTFLGWKMKYCPNCGADMRGKE